MGNLPQSAPNVISWNATGASWEWKVYRRDVMTGNVDPETRSGMMAEIHSKDYRPEVLARSLLHSRDLRFSRISSGLTRRPDVVLPRRGVALLEMDLSVAFMNAGFSGCPALIRSFG